MVEQYGITGPIARAFGICHLIATIPEHRGSQRSPRIPVGAHPASADQQAAVAEVADDDAYNWGYDPLHWGAPEGSYATDGNQDGGARTYQFREMVGALHATGLQVVLDEVFNHTAAAGQAESDLYDEGLVSVFADFRGVRQDDGVDVVSFVILILVLMVRPDGILGSNLGKVRA